MHRLLYVISGTVFRYGCVQSKLHLLAFDGRILLLGVARIRGSFPCFRSVKMARRMASEYCFPSLPTANWFPGHMAKATRLLRNTVPGCDCIVEVHDARVSFFN